VVTNAWYSPVSECYMEEKQVRETKAGILLELDENEKHLNRLRGKARLIGRDFLYLAELLDTHPEKVVFRNEETPLEFQNRNVADPSSFDLAALKDLRDKIRILIKRQKELERRKPIYD